MQCFAVCCVLQYCVVCCSVMQCDAVRKAFNHRQAYPYVHKVCCSVLQCVTLCCNAQRRLPRRTNPYIDTESYLAAYLVAQSQILPSCLRRVRNSRNSCNSLRRATAATNRKILCCTTAAPAATASVTHQPQQLLLRNSCNSRNSLFSATWRALSRPACVLFFCNRIFFSRAALRHRVPPPACECLFCNRTLTLCVYAVHSQ